MIEHLKISKEILEKYHQEHLLNFYDELDDKEKNFLLNQISRINFEEILNLYEASKSDEIIPTNSIEPLPYVDKTKISEQDQYFYENIGGNYISRNKFAVVTMAGRSRY